MDESFAIDGFMQTSLPQWNTHLLAQIFISKPCHIKHEEQHRVVKEMTQKGKSSVGWFDHYQFHSIICYRKEMMAFKELR